MTKQEQIEAMAQALARKFAEATCDEEGGGETIDQYVDEYWPAFKADAIAALDAADVEGMVRQGVIEGINHGAREKGISGATVDAIVARVCG